MISRISIAVSLLLVIAPAAYPGEKVLVGSVLDVRSGELTDSGVVVIADERITCVGETEECEWPEEAEVHDYDDAVLMPGLIDTHVHLRAGFAPAFLAAGVTSVRDATSPLPEMQAARERTYAPRLQISGPMLDSSSSMLFMIGATGETPEEADLEEVEFLVTDSAEDAEEAVDMLAEAGVDWIKIHNRIPRVALDAAVERARDHEIPVMMDLGMVASLGLMESEVDIVAGAESGARSNEHLSGLALAYQAREGDPLAEDLDDSLINEISAELAEHDQAIVPTLALQMQLRDPEALRRSEFPAQAVLEEGMAGHMAGLAGMRERMADFVAADAHLAESVMERLLDEDVLIAAGSDSPAGLYVYPGVGLHMELEALVRAGMLPARAVRAATVDAAKLLGEDDIGLLESGAHADVLVLSCDPSRDVGCVSEIESVYFSGEKLDREKVVERIELDQDK